MLTFYLVLLAGLLCLCAPAQGFAQTEAQYADSSESVRLNAYLKQAKEVFFTNKPLSKQLAEKALALAQNRKEYALETADTYNLLGLAALYDGRHEEASKLLDKSLALSTANNLPAIRLKALSNTALNYLKMGEYQKSIQANFAILPLVQGDAQRLNRGKVLANLADAYSYLGRYEESNRYELEAVKLYESANYTQGISTAYNTLGSNYTGLKQYGEASKYLTKAIAIKQSLKDTEGEANASLNLATLYQTLKNTAEAWRYLQRAAALYKSINNKKGLIKAYVNMGAHHAKAGDYAKAQEMELKALELAKGEKDEYVNATLYSNVSDNYAKLNDLSKAYDFSKKALVSKDSLVNLTVQKQIADMQVRYETERKERQVQEQKLQLAQGQLELTQKQSQIAKRNYVITGGLALMVLAAVIAFLAYRRYRWKQEAKMQAAILKQQEQATKAVLEAEEAERQRIAKDLHDGVGQMMSAAKMNLSAYEHGAQFATSAERQSFERIIQLVDESCTEVRAVSHNMMPNALLKASLAAAVREFISKLDNRQLAAHLYTEGLDERLDANMETVLYRVIQECVNNVIKHAGASRLDISIVREAAGIDVTIEDNGRGFDTAQRNEGLGLKNIRTRMDYLKGTVDFDSAPGRGTVVGLHIPLLPIGNRQ